MAMLLSAMLQWGEILGGTALLLVILYDLFQSVVLPRPAINKLATVRYLLRGIWWVWRGGGERVGSIPPRGRGLASYGPGGGLAPFIVWGLGGGVADGF